jgi:hypothetical protein
MTHTLAKALGCLLRRINNGEEFPDACFSVCWSHKVKYDDLAAAYDLECLAPRPLPKTVLVAGYGWPVASH